VTNIFLGSLEILSLIPNMGIRKDKYRAETELAELFSPFFLLLYLRVCNSVFSLQVVKPSITSFHPVLAHKASIQSDHNLPTQTCLLK